MKRLDCLRAIYPELEKGAFATTAKANTIQNLPNELRGKWIVGRELPTLTVFCWGESKTRP